MGNFLLRLLSTAVALVVAAEILPGISFSDDGLLTIILVALIFGVVNAILKPILAVLSCPLIILTLGLFLFVLNGVMLLITDELAGGRFDVDGLGSAILGGIIISLVNMVLEGLLGVNEDNNKQKRVEVID